MERLYGQLYEDNTFILHGNNTLITGHLNKNNTIDGVSYYTLTGLGNKSNNKKVLYNKKYISIPIIQKTENNEHIFDMNKEHANGHIGNKEYAIIHITEQGNRNILNWVFVNYEDLEYTSFNFDEKITYNESSKKYYTSDSDYILCNDITIYNNEKNIDKWMYITLDNIVDYTYNFKYLFIDSIKLTCYTDIKKIIICYNNDKKQVFENITNIRDSIYLKCNSNVSTITKIYFKISKSIKPLCNNQCGEFTEMICNTCNGSGLCTKCDGSGLYKGTNCTICNGAKSCIDCNGQGYILAEFEINQNIHQKNKIGISNIDIEARKYVKNGFDLYE